METTSTSELHEANARAHDIVSRFERGELSAQVTLMELLLALLDTARVDALLRARPHPALLALWSQNHASCVAMVGDLHRQTQTPAEEAAAVEHIRRLFDQLVSASEESSVAMYSLGNPEILAEATLELTQFLRAYPLLKRETRVLDLGCGIGRMAGAIAGEVHSVHGVDVSTAMIAAARRRHSACANVSFAATAGTDLRELADESYSLVLAIDSFPYVVDAGEALVDRMFGEVRRTLRADGHFVIFNYSYRDIEQDIRDVLALAKRHGFGVQSVGTTPLKLWNGRLFSLIKQRPACVT